MTSNIDNQYGEGLSIQRPPLFDGSNYNYWKCRMKIYLQSFSYEMWSIVENEFSAPITSADQWTQVEKKNVLLNSKAMNALFCAFNKDEFN